MKLLFNNLFQSATLTATNADDSFPISRVTDRLLELRFKGITMTSTVTAEWATDQVVSCITLGYHNLSSGTYTLKDSGGSTVGSGSLEVDYDTNITYFTAVPTVRSIELSLTSASILYVGGLGCGNPFSTKSHNANPRIERISRDKVTFLDGGQTIGQRKRSPKSFRATFNDLTEEQIEEIEDGVDEVGGWFPIYADLYDANHSKVRRPIYGILASDNRFVRDTNNGHYSTTVVVKESR